MRHALRAFEVLGTDGRDQLAATSADVRRTLDAHLAAVAGVSRRCEPAGTTSLAVCAERRMDADP